ncbi:hypothetical protein HYT84_02515 [Candidatus Micrarchaeota archaeon]|nr:hypothetical protein [Candidatus Micrarchaeota archaeon]
MNKVHGSPFEWAQGNWMNLKNLFFLLMLFALIYSAPADPKTTEEAVKKVETSSGLLELFTDWRVISILVTLLTGLLVAAAYMAGISFDIPDLKAWASVESSQILTNGLIILLLVTTLTFLDGMVAVIVNGSGTTVTCGATSGPILCVQQLAKAYTQDLIELVKDDSGSLIQKSYDLGLEAGKRHGFSCNMFLIPPCLWISFSFGENPHLMVDIERINFVLEHYGNIGASLYAQLFFVEKISFTLGPLLIALGIVGRSFFVTRRLGGLLIAIAIGIMFVFPLMYAFNWLTLTVYVFGDKMFSSDLGASCPAVCKQPIVAAYYPFTGSTVVGNTEVTQYSYGEIFEKLDDKDAVDKQGVDKDIVNLNNALQTGAQFIDTASGKYGICLSPHQKTIDEYLEDPSVNYLDETQKSSCPEECRKLPYPSTLKTCTYVSIQKACAKLEEQCKIKTIIPKDDPSVDLQQAKLCPDKCKTIPAMQNNCNVHQVHFYQENLFKTGYELEEYGTVDTLNDCVGVGGYDFDAPLSEDNFFGYESASISEGNYYYPFKKACMDILGIEEPQLLAIALMSGYDTEAKGYTSCDLICEYQSGCLDSKLSCRINQYELDENEKIDPNSIKQKNNGAICSKTQQLAAQTCPVNLAPAQSCTYLIPKDVSECEGCVFADPTYTVAGDTNYDSFAVVDCVKQCGGDKAKAFAISTGEFAQVSGEGVHKNIFAVPRRGH